MKKLLPLHAMAENFGLVSKSMRPKLGRKSYFTPEGKVALMFLKMYTGLSCPKLMEQLNGNIHYQMFCMYGFHCSARMSCNCCIFSFPASSSIMSSSSL